MIQVMGTYENGQITLQTPLPKKKAKVIVTMLEDEGGKENLEYGQIGSKRIAGLNKGTYFMSDDFDAPLPDSFWLGEL